MRLSMTERGATRSSSANPISLSFHRLSGDEGARSILRRHTLSVAEVETANPGVLRDVDTREDFYCSRSGKLII